MMEGDQGNRAHRKKTTGRSFDIKQSKNGKSTSSKDKSKNHKAFSVANIGRTKREGQRNMDRAQKKELVPLVDRTEEIDPPPIIVVIMGPKGVGKSTLIRSLIKLWSGQNLKSTNGSINVVSSPKRRITLFECPPDLHSMADLAKVADLVLLMIDANYGFEMDTFEFLNLLQLHGFPKVVGVLTHLDTMKVGKSLQKTKSSLKHRFWTEIYDGAKVFDFTGTINGKYLKHQVRRLALYINRVKFRPLIWRNTHPYVLADRIEDITPRHIVAADAKCNRDVTFYGYIRGSHLKSASTVHLLGVGDFSIHSVTSIDDPCRMPRKSVDSMRIRKKEDTLYAPQANVGLINMGTDGVYVDLKDVRYTKDEALSIMQSDAQSRKDNYEDPNAPVNLLRGLQDITEGIDNKVNNSAMNLFSDQVTDNYASEFNEENVYDTDNNDDSSSNSRSSSSSSGSSSSSSSGGEDSSDEDGSIEGNTTDGNSYLDGNQDKRHISASGSGSDSGSDSDYDGDDNNGMRSRSKRHSKIEEGFQRRASLSHQNIMTRVYGANWMDNAKHSVNTSTNGNTRSNDGTLFGSTRNENADIDFKRKDIDSSSRLRMNPDIILLWQQVLRLTPPVDNDKKIISQHSMSSKEQTIFRNRFVVPLGDTGGISKLDDDDEFPDDGVESMEEDDDENIGDDDQAVNDGYSDDDDGHNEDGASGSDSDDNDEDDEKIRRQNASLKASSRGKKELDDDDDLSGKDDDDIDDSEIMQKAIKKLAGQKDRNREEFSDDNQVAVQRFKGYSQGEYVKVVLCDVPHEFLSGFQSELPVILGGLMPHETKLGFVTARVKRHRWHGKILKSNDPLVFSIGWRRFQSIPIYSLEDGNDRRRFLKYTPEHMHCYATFYGPMVLPNTGIIAYQRTSNSNTHFRLCMTGTALDMDTSSDVVKKLKLVGTPMKVFRNTAFITGMFTSELEVAKFQGAKLRTVSGIRGKVKRAITQGEAGNFRATFEDKILMSDIVICRLWVPILPFKYYNPVSSLLQTNDVKWTGLRTISEIRRKNSVPITIKKDSLYRPIVERKKREFKKLVIPKKLAETLPYASKPKQTETKKKGNYVERRAVLMDAEERSKRATVQVVSGIGKSKIEKRQSAQSERVLKKRKAVEREEDILGEIRKEEKKIRYIQKAAADSSKAKGGGKRGSR